jgi:hypothetical protein
MGPLAFVPEVGAKPQTDAYEPAPRNVILFGFNMSNQLAKYRCFSAAHKKFIVAIQKSPRNSGAFSLDCVAQPSAPSLNFAL